MENLPLALLAILGVAYLGRWGFNRGTLWYYRRQQWKAWNDFQALRRKAWEEKAGA